MIGRTDALDALKLLVAPGVLHEQVLVIIVDLDDLHKIQGVLIAVAGLQIVKAGQVTADNQRQEPGRVGVFRKV